MKVTTEELERCEVLVTVEIEPRKEQDMLNKAAKRIAREVRIPGFRPGKAPYNVVVRRFGLEAIQQEALENSVDKMLQDALEDVDVEPYAQIQLESIDWDPLTIKVKIPTKPVVKLGNYRDVRLDVEEVEVTDEDVQQTLENLQEQTATWNPVERPAEIGDLVSMAVVEKDGDDILAEHESMEYELDPPDEHEGHDHPDLTTPLLGLEAGDEKTFTLTYSETFDDDRYAGKDITFEVEILSVKEKEVDPLDDDFAMSVSDFETLDELKADIEERLREQRQRQKDMELGDKALEQIIAESTIEWSEAYENERVEREVERYERQLQSYGLNLENFLTVQNKTKEEYLEETRQEVVGQMRRGLVLTQIAELEKLNVSEGEILNQAKLIADMSGQGEQVWRNILASDTRQSMIAGDLLLDKALTLLAAIAKGENPQPNVEDTTEDDAEETSQASDAADVDAAEASVDEPESEDEASGDDSQDDGVDETPEAASPDEVEDTENQ